MREDLFLGRVHAYRYPPMAEPPRYHLLIVHGIGGHGGAYDVFCEPMAARGVSVYSMDLPGHGRARNPRGIFRFEQWLQDIDEAAGRIKAQSNRPLFVLGSSQGSAAGFHCLEFSGHVDGAVTMGLILTGTPFAGVSGTSALGTQFSGPAADEVAHSEGDGRQIDLRSAIDWNRDYAREDGRVLERNLADPLRTWSYGFASLHSYWNYHPPVDPRRNRKPILVTVGGEDPLVPPQYVEACFARIGGPKAFYVMPGAGHQLMKYYTDQYIEVVDEWISRQVDLLDKSASGSVKQDSIESVTQGD